MAEAEVHQPSTVPASSPSLKRSFWAKGFACVSVILMVGFIGRSGHTLWAEWISLRQEQVNERGSAVVGYIDINPNPSFAATPVDWFHHEGTESLLWAGWKDGKNHWFRIGRDEIDIQTFSLPIGRDTVQAIDSPIYEREGGPRWVRIPFEAKVFGIEEEGKAIAYPLKVLNKVLVINDQVGNRPILITLNLNSDVVSIFEATLDGRRVTMGHGGYFQGDRSVLYDRGSKSLWSEGEATMESLAGPLKGSHLKKIKKINLVAWGEWRDKNPDGHLLVGADRPKALPID